MTALLRQSLRFGIVGLLNTAVGLAAIYAVLLIFRTGPAVANAVGYTIGLALSFMLNRLWTFGSRHRAAALLPRYLLVVLIAYLLNLATVLTLVWLIEANPYTAQLPGMAVYTLAMFGGSRWFVFAPASVAQAGQSAA